MMDTPRGQIAFFAAVLLLLAGTGCLEMEQSFVFARDGSCIVTWNASVPSSIRPALEQAAKTGQEKFNLTRLPFWPPDRETVQAYCDSHPSIELREYRDYQENGRSKLEIVVLAREAIPAFNEEAFPGFTLRRDDLGDLTLTRHIPVLKDKFSPAELKLIHPLLKDAVLTLKVQVPTAIIEGNGRRPQFNQAVWVWATDPAEDELPFFGNTLDQVSVKW